MTHSSDHVFLLYLKEIQTLSLPCGRVYPSLTEFTERFKNALLSLKEKPETFYFSTKTTFAFEVCHLKKMIDENRVGNEHGSGEPEENG